MKKQKFDLPDSLISILKDHGINDFYPPQKKALPIVLKGENLVLSIPTASGKSLVAYIAIVNKLLKYGGKALYVVPLIALAKEKYEELKLFEKLGFKIGITTGDLDDSNPRLGRYDIIVCTSEKADSLIRHRVAWIHDVRILVIDEIHLIHDPSRGPTLEILISHFKSLVPDIQLIALSATIQNAIDLSAWFNGSLIQSDWRPVPLKEGVFYEQKITFNDGKTKNVESSHREPLYQLVEQSILNGGQVLIFVNTRRSTISVAQNLMPIIKKTLSKDEKLNIDLIIDKMKKYNVEHTSIDEKLMACIMNGVAFHHAGLSSAQRKTVETEFKNGFIKCIVATPTLAAGVNIPAQRVIVRDLWRYDFGFGMKPIPVLEYKQQAGRAGRPRFDSFGEAITIAKNNNQKNQILNNYIHGDVEPIYSKLGNKSALRMHLLAAISTGFIKSMQDIFTFIDSTFYAYQAETYSLKTQIDETIEFLIENDFITSENDVITPTILGQRTSSLYIDPMSAVRIKKAIEASNTKQTSELSILHIICSTPDVRSLYLKKTDGWVEQIADSILDEFLIQVPNAYEEEYEWFLSDLKTALLVNDWIEEKTENDLINKYGVGPGDIHSIVESSGWMIYATREIARMYNFNLLSFLSDMLIRTRNGCKKELLNLISLKGIGRIRARSLFNAGFKSINDLRKVPIHSIAEVKTIGPRIAENIKKQIGENQKFSEKQYL